MQVAQKILEAHANVRDFNLNDSKLRYIKAWQALPEYGITYHICKFVNPFKGELCKKEVCRCVLLCTATILVFCLSI